MSVDWATIRTLIASQVSTLGGVAAANVRWADEPSGPLAGAEPIVWMRVTSISNIGREEERIQKNGTNDETVNVVGQRDFTLSLRAESFTPDITDARNGASILQNLKTRIFRSTAVEQRKDAFAVREYGATKWFSYIADNRQRNVYIADFFCMTVDNDLDTSSGAGGFIDEVISTGTATLPGGATSTLNLDIKGP